jgi:hypothetical protein
MSEIPIVDVKVTGTIPPASFEVMALRTNLVIDQSWALGLVKNTTTMTSSHDMPEDILRPKSPANTSEEEEMDDDDEFGDGEWDDGDIEEDEF